MLDRTHPVVLRFANLARARYGMFTAFRLGYLVGESGEAMPCPYDDERGRALFAAGVTAGHEGERRRYAREEGRQS